MDVFFLEPDRAFRVYRFGDRESDPVPDPPRRRGPAARRAPPTTRAATASTGTATGRLLPVFKVVIKYSRGYEREEARRATSRDDQHRMRNRTRRGPVRRRRRRRARGPSALRPRGALPDTPFSRIHRYRYAGRHIKSPIT